MGGAFSKIFLKKNPTIAIFVIAFLVGFGVCWVCYKLCHRIFFKTSKINEGLLYAYCVIGGIIWGVVAVDSFDLNLNSAENNASNYAKNIQNIAFCESYFKDDFTSYTETYFSGTGIKEFDDEIKRTGGLSPKSAIMLRDVFNVNPTQFGYKKRRVKIHPELREYYEEIAEFAKMNCYMDILISASNGNFGFLNNMERKLYDLSGGLLSIKSENRQFNELIKTFASAKATKFAKDILDADDNYINELKQSYTLSASDMQDFLFVMQFYKNDETRQMLNILTLIKDLGGQIPNKYINAYNNALEGLGYLQKVKNGELKFSYKVWNEWINQLYAENLGVNKGS